MISTATGAHGYFVLRLDEKFEGIPEEIAVFLMPNVGSLSLKKLSKGYGQYQLRPGDKVHVKGEIVQDIHKSWQKEFTVMIAQNIWNETLHCGI
ncbi:MAG: hypothetical protein ACFFCM_02710 [Promethearchaeota archaeon]